MLKHKKCVVLLVFILVLVPSIVSSNAMVLEKQMSTALNTTHTQTGLEVLVAVAEISKIPLPRGLSYIVEPTGHLILFLEQSSITVQNLLTGQTKTFIIKPPCRPTVLDDLSGIKHVLIVCPNDLIYHLNLEREPHLYGPYRPLKGEIVGIKRIGEYTVTVNSNGLIVVYRDSLMDPYKTIKLPVQASINKAYIVQSKGNYTTLITVIGESQNRWFVAVVDLTSNSVVYTYNSPIPLVAAYVIDARSPYRFKLLTIRYDNGITSLELTTIEGSKLVLQVHEDIRLPFMPQAFLYAAKRSYILSIVGGGIGYLIDIYPDTMLIKSRFAWYYTRTIKEYVPVVIHQNQEHVVAVDSEGLRLLDSSGTPKWYIAASCRDPVLVYCSDKIVVVEYNGELIVIRPKREFFEKLALLTVYAPKLHIDVAKKVFIPTITISSVEGNINITVNAKRFSLLLPLTSYNIEVMYRKLNITNRMYVVLEPPVTKVKIPIKMTSYTICVKGLADPSNLLPRNQPIPGAIIRIYTVEGVKLGEIRTGEDGCAQTNLPYTLYHVKIDAPGYIGGLFEIAGSNTVILLEPKLVQLEVRVVDTATRHEIPNAQVELIGFGKRTIVPANTPIMVPSGTYMLVITAEGYLPEKVKLVVSRPKTVRVHIKPSVTEIRAIDSLTGQSIGEFHINVIGSTIYGVRYSTSREAGGSALLELPPGYYTVTISAKDYSVKEFVLRAPTSKIVKLKPNLIAIVERQAKAILRPAVSDPMLTAIIIVSVIVAITIVKSRKKIRNIIEKAKKKIKEASRAGKRREEVLEELRKLVEEAGI